MPGRKRRGHNRDYWFRTGRGWYITLPGGKSIPLRDPEGKHIRDRHAPQDLLRQSYAQWLVHHGNGQNLPDKEDLTTVDICRYFLAHLKQSAKPTGFKMRAQMLFDFCTGYPGSLHGKKEVPSDLRRIHPGFGKIPVMQLTPRHVEEWLAAHPRWGASTRAVAIASLKRALNYAVKAKLLGANPLREVRMPKYRARVTYFSPEEEEALRANGHPRFAETLWVCIRTGVRPGEFCRLSSEHVEETPRGQRWRFPAEET